MARWYGLGEGAVWRRGNSIGSRHVLASGMAEDDDPGRTAALLEETHGGLAKALGLFWALCLLTIGGVTVLRVMDPSTSIEVPTGPIRGEDGAWRLEPVEAACRQALEAHGVDPVAATPIDYSPGEHFGTNPSRPDRLLTAWLVGEDRRRVTVHVEMRGAVARCKVSESK